MSRQVGLAGGRAIADYLLSSSAPSLCFGNHGPEESVTQGSEQGFYQNELHLLPPSSVLEASAVSFIGFRKIMEDACSILIENNGGNGYFGVFDGHRGPDCANFCAEQFTDIVQNVFFRGNGEPDVLKRIRSSMQFPEEYKRKLSRQLERLFWNIDQNYYLSNFVGKSKVQRVLQPISGSTAAVLILTQCVEAPTVFRATIAHVGDTRIVLLRKNGVNVSITTDHSPDIPRERARVVAAGGMITRPNQTRIPRVNNNLAMTRAMGNFDFKENFIDYLLANAVLDHGVAKLVQNGNNFQETADSCIISARPDVTTFTCNAGDSFLLFSDGLLHPEFRLSAALKFVRKRKGKEDSLTCMRNLVKRSYELGSEDNITAMLVSLLER